MCAWLGVRWWPRISRLVGEIVSPEVRAAGNEVRKLMATYKERPT